jgi:hypothetical protein
MPEIRHRRRPRAGQRWRCGLCGSRLAHRMPERAMRLFVVAVGLAQTAWMFMR